MLSFPEAKEIEQFRCDLSCRRIVTDLVRGFSLALLMIFLLSSFSNGQTCNYGLGYYSSTQRDCSGLETRALKQVAGAKSICYSANSQVLWNKNSKQPQGAFAAMREGARIAMRGFTSLYGCERADLVVRIDYDDAVGNVTLTVTDAESGNPVFREERSVSDLSSDVSRMASHFQNMASNARAAAKAVEEEGKARVKEQSFLARLPKHWQFVTSCAAAEESPCPRGSAIDVWAAGDLLYEAATDYEVNSEGSRKLKVSCRVKRGETETEPWSGTCTYELFWHDATSPACVVNASETITSITSKEITGQSQKVDYTPLRQTPPGCPQPANDVREFKLIPATGKP